MIYLCIFKYNGREGVSQRVEQSKLSWKKFGIFISHSGIHRKAEGKETKAHRVENSSLKKRNTTQINLEEKNFGGGLKKQRK